jgi:V/A-type H+/Na+-transporting ATPase subunit D
MPKLKLSKSALQVQRTQLQLYQRLLPSLDMKRRQLTVEHEKAKTAYAEARRIVDELESNIGRELPMLANTEMDLSSLVKLKRCVTSEENVVGVRLPVLKAIEVEVADYSMMARPAWVDRLVTRLQVAAEQRMRVDVAGRRLGILEKSTRQITQRVNLFERILIPQAKNNIRRIRIFLGDLERDSVVRSKLAKSRGMAVTLEDAT